MFVSSEECISYTLIDFLIDTTRELTRAIQHQIPGGQNNYDTMVQRATFPDDIDNSIPVPIEP